MGEIIPRWEWRSFAEGFGDAEDRIRSAGDANVRESAETYVVSRVSGENTKVRGGLMDIKALQTTDANGLEQWKPVLKEGFPIDTATIDRVFEAWRVSPGTVAREEYGFEEFVGEIVAPHNDLRAVAVTKKRAGYTIMDATVELAELTIDGQAVRTICVEHTDPELVWRVVGELGLQALENVNYLKAIKRTIGWESA